MIRPATPDDLAAIVGLAVAAGLFPEEEVAIVRDLMAGFFADPGDALCLVDADPAPVAVAYAGPVPATDGTFDVTMIAVHPSAQGTGRGGALMRALEERLGADGRHLVLVQTSATPEFAGARAFYAALGYEKEARVRDYYAPGADMVLFRKALR